MPLPTNRTTSDTIEEHIDDHNALNTQHNELEGHAADTTSVHGIANTAVLALTSHDHDADYEPIGAAAAAAAALVDAAPGTLDTLNELAAALGDDASFASTVTTSLAGKAATSHNHDASYEATGAVATHTGDTSAAHAASAVAFTPTGTVAATDVQAAIAEVDSEKATTGHTHTGTYVALADLDAKGDLLVASGNDAYDNLPVGTNDFVLTADSAQTLGVKWAAASGSSAVVEGRFGAANFILPGVIGSTTTTLVITANLLYYEPILVATSITLDRLALEVTTGAASSNVRMGIYNADTDWQPTSLVIDGGTVATATLGVKTVTINQALSVGRYLLVLHSDGTPTLRVVRGTTPGGPFDSGLGGTPFINGLRKTTAYAVLAGTGVAWDTVGTAGTPFQHMVFTRVSTP